MKLICVYMSVFFSFVLVAFGQIAEIQKKSSAKKLKVEVVSIEAGILTFKTKSKKSYKVSLDELTIDSVEKVAEAMKEQSVKGRTSEDGAALFEKVNAIIGHQLFGTSQSLWEEKGAAVAGRLNWPRESIKETSSSYRSYTKMDYQFLGAHPYCLTLYGGKDDSPEQFSLVYANKGDFGSQFGMGADHFKKVHPDKTPPRSLDEAIDMDAQLIEGKLTEALGVASEQYYGEKEDKRKVKRWDLLDHSFLLSVRDGEYVYLMIVPKSNADAKGKIKFIKDAELKGLHIKNIRKKDNGDVWIDNIPMVNQGPKGYCAPATFERAMRYMQVPADMYLLATAATTKKGTNTFQLADDCKRIVRSKARRIKDLTLEKDFKIKSLKKFIDKGVPILWQMRSLPQYNKIADRRSRDRKDVTDWSEWTTKIQNEAASALSSLNIEANHHICMVIGYNEETEEVAVSDSWGPAYEIRWVHVDIAKAVTVRGGFVIDF